MEGCLLISAFKMNARKLTPQAEAFDQGLVAGKVPILQVAEQALALIDQLEQATTRVVVLDVILEMAGEMIDAGGQQGHLDFGRTRIVRHAAKISNDLAGLFCGKGHGYAFP